MAEVAGEEPRILGRLHAEGGKGLVRIQDVLTASPDEVWDALTNPKRLADWLGEIRGDLCLGGEYQGHWRVSGWNGTGRIEVCEPPRRLVLATRETDEEGERDEQRMDVTIAPVEGGSSILVQERGMPLEQVAAYGAGTQVHVEDLAAHVAGRPERHTLDRWKLLFPGYEALQVDAL